MRLLALPVLAALVLPGPSLAAQEGWRVERNALVPDTSIRHTEDAGVKCHTNHRILLTPAGGLGPAGGVTPAQLLGFYAMPATGGHGAIAIIDAYHYPSSLNDFNVFSKTFGLPRETSANATASTNKVFQVVYAGGRQPNANSGWSLEAALDIEWAHAMAPGAKIFLVEAQSASLSALFSAIQVAKGLAGVQMVSMSWGTTEWSGESEYDAYFQGNGPVFFAAAGDTGGAVDYPACSPYVVAAGGTTVTTSSAGAWTGESAWIDGGGGPSQYEPRPAWQAGVATLPGSHRGIPDLACDADPNSGLAVYDTTRYEGYYGWLVVGGTSASTQCLAGMANLSGQAFAGTTQFLTTLYQKFIGASAPFRDITAGTNGEYSAGPGWDFCTGVGTPLNPSAF
jgi:kumamolisin